MALPTEKRLSVDDFRTFVERPENSEKRFELIDGEVSEVPSNPFASVTASRIITLTGMYLMQQEVEGHVTGEGGGYLVDGNIYAPDVAFIRTLPTANRVEPNAPLLAVEAVSNPQNSAEHIELRRKLFHYMRAGVVVWIVDYAARVVEVHSSGEAVRLFDAESTRTVPDVLPGFELAVKDIFPRQ